MSAGIKANVDGSAAIQVGGTDVITLTSGGAATFVTSPTTVQAGTAAAPSITTSGDTNTGIFFPAADTIAFAEGGAEVARFDSAGNFGLGTSSPNTKLHLAAAGDVGGKAVNSATTGSATFNVTNNSGSIGQLMIYGSAQGAYGALGSGEVAMYCTTSTTLMVDNVSGVLKFTTGGNTERARIASDGTFMIGSTDLPNRDTTTGVYLGNGVVQGVRSSNASGDFGRLTTGGDIVVLRLSGVTQGSISGSGTTISYNSFAGSHWSQLQDGSKPEILRGTVMESINELCEWPDEPNTERLCRVKISDTEGSKKVYGVFMDWDNDWTATNDMLVTAVGAFVCRVNGSVTVQQGDLLESNGDGTARVQADDIIRSSTIGKVTCTAKTQEYDDGSYCVPTVLYCG